MWGYKGMSFSLTLSGRLESHVVSGLRTDLSLLLISACYTMSSRGTVPSGTLFPVYLTPIMFHRQNLMKCQFTPISSSRTVKPGCFGWRQSFCWPTNRNQWRVDHKICHIKQKPFSSTGWWTLDISLVRKDLCPRLQIRFKWYTTSAHVAAE